MPASGKVIPVIHDTKPCDGILTNRQKTWLSCATNDIKTENPVIFRHKANEQSKQNLVTETKAESVNVRGLRSEFSDKNKSSAGLIEKIQKSRRERHEVAFEDMIQELAAISFELEPQIHEICKTIKGFLDSDLKEMEYTFKVILKDDTLIMLSMEDLNKLWCKIEKHSPQRSQWINDLDKSIQKIEQNRASLISEVFKAYKGTLENIAHMMPADVQRLMENEIMKVNKSMLQNQKSISDLIAQLLIADIDLQRKFYIKWQNRCLDWKSLKLEESIQNHKDFMESEAILNPPSINRLLTVLAMTQKSLNKKRLDLLQQLRSMMPPNSTKTIVYQWNCALTALTDELDCTNSKFITDMKSERNRILKECDEYIVNLKNTLTVEEIVNDTFIQELFEDTFLPLVGERKANFDYQIELFEKHISEVSAGQKLHFRELFKYTQGVAHLWDIHEIGLTKEERQLQEILDKNRRDHDYQNQIKEAKLDIVMDRMRQDSNPEALNGSLHQSLSMMENIKNGYLEFHKQQQKACHHYPKMIKDELKRYTTTILHYFNAVDKRIKTESPYPRNCKVMYTELLSNGASYDIMDVPAMDESEPPSSAMTRTSEFSTRTFMTDLDDNAERENMPYIEPFIIPLILFNQMKKSICKMFLEHLQIWNNEADIKAESIMMAKIEETNNELDLRLHLHDPRPGRAEKDVHDVRLAELSVHQERVDQHCTGVLETLDRLKSTYQDMLFGHVQENENFRKSVEELEISFNAAGNTHELRALQDEVYGKLEQFNEIIRASIRQFRRDLDDLLNELRASNAQFRKSLKIFSEGGNFSPDEVDEFRKRLERVSTRIDNCEGNIIGELEGMENKRMEVAKEYAGKLEDRFKQHLFDLTFIEKIKRWLTNIQVKIKAEVANSNSQSQHLSKMISVFSSKLKLIKEPNPDTDKEKYTAADVHGTLIPILQSFRDRVTYLNCAVKNDNLANIPSSVDVVVKSSNDKNRDKNSSRSSSKNRRVQPGKKITSKNKKGSNLSQMANVIQTIQSVQPTRNTIDSQAKAADVSGNTEEPAQPPSTPKPPTGYGIRRNSGVRTSLGGRYDKKYLVFGDPQQEQPAEPETHFLALQTKVLQSGLDGLLSTAEHYYRQKGQRQPTRVPTINESFDACAESLIQRLKKYKLQTESYHNDCIQEFRAQIKHFNSFMVDLPSLLMVSMVTKHKGTCDEAKREIEETLKSKRELSSRLKKEHQLLLRPTLGHPNNKPELEKLKAAELSRQNVDKKSMVDYQRLMNECSNMSARNFVSELNESVTSLLSHFDVALTLDDVIIGEPKLKPKTEKELLCEKKKTNKNQDVSEDQRGSALTSPYTWPLLDVTTLVSDGVLNEQDLITQIQSLKRTQAHAVVIEARDNVFKNFMETRSMGLKKLQENCEVMQIESQRWEDNWKTSIHKITELY